ncbi:MAG: hypothetical protein LBP21_09030 [Synergistaceae bacterium]|jgi:hypothetical protein|nr:hypothetical protein [Synergistaceae bacterium]
MTTATVQTPINRVTTATAEEKELHQAIERLPDSAIFQIKGYIERMREEELKKIEADIAELEAKYGTTPNAETIAAMREAEEGIGEPVTLEQIQAECDALR